MSVSVPPPSLADVLSRADVLPTFPEAARYIITTIDDETSDADSLVEHLSSDPAVAARILAAANSSAFGLSAHVDSMRQAILVLGLKEIRSITLATAVIDRLGVGVTVIDPRALWQHSMGVAICARTVAARLGYNVETAFTAGLLHDIGQLLLGAAAPAVFAEVLQRCQERDELIVEAEQAVFGFDHAQAGAELLRLWRLPADIVDGTAGHHDPESGRGREMADLIHVAEVLSHALDLGGFAGNKVPGVSEIACARMGIVWSEMTSCFAEIETRYDEILLALNLHD